LGAVGVSSCPPSPPAGRAIPHPFLKWAGGKGQLLREIWPLVPPQYGRYFEPFMGGGALFFAMAPTWASLSDVNAELVDCFCVVRDDVEELVNRLRPLSYNREDYYRMRSQEPRRLSAIDRAARTIFLNRTGFNGLFRVNSSGGFNVPFGRHTNPQICDAENLRACSVALRAATIATRDFATILDEVQKGDFVYLDPPYARTTKTSFTAYSASGFGWDEHVRLARVCSRLGDIDCQFVLSNADLPEVRHLYERFSMISVPASRRINARADGRGLVNELLVFGGTGERPLTVGARTPPPPGVRRAST